MVRTTITTSVDSETKEKAYDIIKYDYRKSFSSWLNDELLNVVKKKEQLQIKSGEKIGTGN